MNISPQKRSSTVTIGHTLGNKFLSFAKSRLPVPNKPKMRRRGLFSVAPIPFAPLVDTYTFQPPPPYTAHADDPTDFLRVPHNTPEASPPRVHILSRSTNGVIGLGLEGVERGDGCRFDGLGRLSGGVRGTSDALREEVRRMLSEQRRRIRGSEQPAKRHDVFYASVEVETGAAGRRAPVNIRIRRKSSASPTPGARRWERGTISSELKRAASVERRGSMGETRWRV